jgi:hypothetical protein
VALETSTSGFDDLQAFRSPPFVKKLDRQMCPQKLREL